MTKLALNHSTQFEVKISNHGEGPAWLVNIRIRADNLRIYASQKIGETLLSGESWSGTIEITPKNTVGKNIPLHWSVGFYSIEGESTFDGTLRVEVQDTKAPSITTTHGDIIQQGGIKQGEGVVLQKVSKNDSAEPVQEAKTFGFCPECGEELKALKTPKFCPHCREQWTA